MEKKNLKISSTDHAELLAISKARGISMAALVHEILSQYQPKHTQEYPSKLQTDNALPKDVLCELLNDWAEHSLAPLLRMEQRLQEIWTYLNGGRLSGLIHPARLLDVPIRCPSCGVVIDTETYRMQGDTLSCIQCAYQLILETEAALTSFDLLVLLYGGITRELPGTKTRYLLDPQTEFTLTAI